MRSPPPPAPQQQQSSSYGSPYQPQVPQASSSGGSHFYGNYGGFMNDQTARMGLEIGKSAFNSGQEYMEQSASRYPINTFLLDSD